MTESTADVFAAYLGMTPENAGWAWKKLWLPTGQYGHHEQRFTATSPLAPAPTPGWCETMQLHHAFLSLGYYSGDYTAFILDSVGRHINGPPTKHPTHAVARALIAADHALRARLEACGDWEG